MNSSSASSVILFMSSVLQFKKLALLNSKTTYCTGKKFMTDDKTFAEYLKYVNIFGNDIDLPFVISGPVLIFGHVDGGTIDELGQ